MTGAGIALALTIDLPDARDAASRLFPQADFRILTKSALRPSRPFSGALHDLLAPRRPGEPVGLFVPVVWRANGPPPALIAVSDHVNLALASPLSGRWPEGVPRTFPALTGIYQPRVVRARGGARIYSAGVVVAGVGDALRLTPFESGAVHEGGYSAVSDTLVPAAIIAAYYGLTLAACGITQA